MLTSPTYYISYKSVFASDGCSGVGPTLYDTIVPIPATHQLSSVYAGTLPCVAHVVNQFTQEWIATASFNVTDMNQPVPFSIYSSQPWCATYQFEHGCKKECPTTEAYKPIIVVPKEVLQSMHPAWASCYGDIRGAYDPPIALQKESSIIVPQTTAATPIASEAVTALPEHSPSQPAAQTSIATMKSQDLSSSRASASTLQASQSLCRRYGSSSGPCSPLQGIPQDETTRASRPSHDVGIVGGVVASIFGSIAQSVRLISSSSESAPLVGSTSEQDAPHSLTQDLDGWPSKSSMAVMASEKAAQSGSINTQFSGKSQPSTTSQAEAHAGYSDDTGAVMSEEDAPHSFAQDLDELPSKSSMAIIASEKTAQSIGTQVSGESQLSTISQADNSAGDSDDTGAVATEQGVEHTLTQDPDKSPSDPSTAVTASKEAAPSMTTRSSGAYQVSTASQAVTLASDNNDTGAVMISPTDDAHTIPTSASSISQVTSRRSSTRITQSPDSRVTASDANTASTSTATTFTPYARRSMCSIAAAVLTYGLIALMGVS